MIVSDVGRTTSGSARSSPGTCVTNTNSCANPSTCSFSRSSSLSGMNIGKYTFWCPVCLNRRSSASRIASHRAYPYGLITIVPRTTEFSARSA